MDIAIGGWQILNDTPTFDPTGTLLNQDTAGIQRRPKLASVGNGGVAAWISEQEGPVHRVMLRRLDVDGKPAGDEVQADTGGDALRDLALAPVGTDRVAWVAERDAGVLRGGTRVAADLQSAGEATFPATTWLRRYAPDLVAFDDRALLASVGVAATDTRVLLTPLDAAGVPGADLVVSPTVEKGSASPAVARLDPYWAAVAWYDGTDLRDSGIYLALVSPACPAGAVDCSHPDRPAVCVGFGPSGYVTVPGATAWCP